MSFNYIKTLLVGQLTVDKGQSASSLAGSSAPDSPGPGPESDLVPGPGPGHQARGSLPVPVSGPDPGSAGGAV